MRSLRSTASRHELTLQLLQLAVRKILRQLRPYVQQSVLSCRSSKDEDMRTTVPTSLPPHASLRDRHLSGERQQRLTGAMRDP